MPKAVLGNFAENIFQEWWFGRKCRKWIFLSLANHFRLKYPR
jgi:hypothetical protein